MMSWYSRRKISGSFEQRAGGSSISTTITLRKKRHGSEGYCSARHSCPLYPLIPNAHRGEQGADPACEPDKI